MRMIQMDLWAFTVKFFKGYKSIVLFIDSR